MTTLTEIVATVVLQSSAATFSHFGVVPAPVPAVQHFHPAGERVIARSHKPPQAVPAHDVDRLHAAPLRV